MISREELVKRISDLEHGNNASSIIEKGKIDTLYWVKNGEESKTEEEINNKINRIKEEMLIYQPDDVLYKEKAERIKELNFVLS